jgi:hypothetical protein
MRVRTSALLIAASFVYREQPVFDTLLPLPPRPCEFACVWALVEERLSMFPTPKDAALFFSVLNTK